jgi:hypothetical protein
MLEFSECKHDDLSSVVASQRNRQILQLLKRHEEMNMKIKSEVAEQDSAIQGKKWRGDFKVEGLRSA